MTTPARTAQYPASADSGSLIDPTQVEHAASVLRGVVTRTPVVPLDASRPHAWIKAESLQPTGAFKLRGAYYVMSQLRPDVMARGVVAASTGNHAQAVAWAARRFGVQATIVMPGRAPAIKRDKVRKLGGILVDWEPGSGVGINDRASQLAAEQGATVIHSYDDDLALAGAGTVGLEILEDLPDVGAIVVPIGGGGLASGLAAIVRARKSGVRIVAVEPVLAGEVAESMVRGAYQPWSDVDTARTIADGLRANACARTFRHIMALVDCVVTVTDDEIASAVRVAAERTRLVLEPSGATALAACLFRAHESGLDRVRRPVVAVASGGNVDPERFRALLDADGSA